MEGEGEKRDVRRPMNAFLIFCKRHRSMVREKNPDLDNRSVTRILGDLWANLKEDEKCVYTDLAKQYKDAFMKANPDYKWHNPDKVSPNQKMGSPKPGSLKALRPEMDLLSEGSIMPGKLADPSNMGGLSMLLMAGQQQVGTRQEDNHFKVPESRETATGTTLAEKVIGLDREPEPEKKITASQKAVEDAINRTICETALHYNEMFAIRHGQNTTATVTDMPDGSFQQMKPGQNSSQDGEANPNKTLPSIIGNETKLSLDVTTGVRPTSDTGMRTCHRLGNPMLANQPDKGSVAGLGSELTGFMSGANANLLELAKTCSNALDSDKKPTVSTVSNFDKQSISTDTGAKLDYRKPGAPVYKGMLAEALLDTCNKANYTGLLQKNNFKNLNSETLAVTNAHWKQKTESKTVTDGSCPNLNIKNETNECNTILQTSVPKKSEISRILVADVKQEDKGEEEESAMVTCGKMVVNHIIDKLYYSDLASAARKAALEKQGQGQGQGSLEMGQGLMEIPKLPEKYMASLKPPPFDKGSNSHESLITESGNNGTNTVQAALNSSVNFTSVKENTTNIVDEHDGTKGQVQVQTNPVAAPRKTDRYVSKSLKDKILSRVMKEQSCEIPENKNVKNNSVEVKNENDTEISQDRDNNKMIKEKDASTEAVETKTETKTETKNLFSEPQASRKRTISQNSNASSVDDAETEDRDEFHPIRKSKRRNRGQRYQELINEGIIQPSKERMAAMMHATKSNSGEVEDFQSIDSHILPETAIRRIRKRTTSESDKNRVMSLEEAKRYKTGDFDLEAHIATLPACCIENMSRRRGFARQRHSSDTCPNRKPEETEEPAIVIDLEKTVSLPPHIKIPTPEKDKEPVTGSRKRKARKHSITHLLPAPAQSLVTNSKTKSQVNSARKDSTSSQNFDAGPSEVSPGQQTVSQGLNQKCKKCAKADNNSMNLDKNSTDSDSVEGGQPSQTGNVELRSENVLDIATSFEKDRNSAMASLRDSGDVNVQKNVNGESRNENDHGDSSFVSCENQSIFKYDRDADQTSSKHLDDTAQCHNEKQTVSDSEDQEMRKQSANQSDVKSFDLMKEGGVLYADDLVLGKDVISEQRGQIDSAVDKDGDSQDVNIQNKENVVQKDVVLQGECDISVKVDVVQSEIPKEKHWPGDRLKLTLEQGQITPDGVNMFVVSEGCDKLMSSAINTDAKDVNFNSEVQSH